MLKLAKSYQNPIDKQTFLCYNILSFALRKRAGYWGNHSVKYLKGERMELFVVGEFFALTVVQIMLMITFALAIVAMMTKRHYILTAEMAMATAVAQALASYAGIEWTLTFVNAILCLILAVVCVTLDYKKQRSDDEKYEKSRIH